MSATDSSMRRPGRAAGSTNLAVATVILVVLLPSLLTAGTTAPPPAAEFAPSADQIIEEPPADQAAAVTGTAESNGTGEGGPVGDGEGEGAGVPEPEIAEPEPSEAPELIVPPDQVKRCVGPPPERQTEDPQSPPCIKFFEGDNGGATAEGVTAEAIYIAIPTPESFEAEYAALQNHFNNRYQFYGRKLVFQYCASSGGGLGSSDEANQRADAQLAASGCGGGPRPFASNMYRTANGPHYQKAMACTHGIIAVGTYSPYPASFLNECPGLLYQYSMEVDEQFANIGEWSCKRLVGRNAQFAGTNSSNVVPEEMSEIPRKFAVMMEPFGGDESSATRENLAPIVDRIRACGGDLEEKHVFVDPVDGSFDPPSAQNAILQVAGDGVTSIICMCNFFSFGTLQRAAEGNLYEPEWITGTYGLNDIDSSYSLGLGPDNQMVRTFGLTFNPRTIEPLLNPYNMAVQDGDPSVQPQTVAAVEGKLEIYRGLLVLATGIQMAGPNLTPETFRDGLRRTTWPNPRTPLMAGDIDVKPDGYSFTADGAEWWYGLGETGPFSNSNSAPGTVCYIDGGARYKLGGWPEGDKPLFEGPCG